MTTFTRTFTYDRAAYTAPTLAQASELAHVDVEFERTAPGHYYVNLEKLIDDLGWSHVIEQNQYDFDELFVRALDRLTNYVDRQILDDRSFFAEAAALTEERQSIWVIDHVAVMWLSTAMGILGSAGQLSVVGWLEEMLHNIRAFD